MERKIKNVYAQSEYYCFGCSPHNPIGLHLEFIENDDYIQTLWFPSLYYEGYPGNVHGGILATLLDETAAWTMYIKARCAGVTSRMNLRYRKGLPTRLSEVIIRGKVKEMNRNLCYITTEVIDKEGVVYVEAEVVYFTFSHEKSVNEAFYPADYNSFFEE
ncbi:MAG: PaaI family thioesterase [Bacteroidales bacterium]|jgi:hypothetical protein|nr:PaaI family thioesterase [Bacteroidales bacterium]